MMSGLTRARAIIIVAAVALVVHGSSLWNMFAYDDVAIIRRDQRVQSLANLPQIWATNYWNDDSQALYRPLVTTSYAIDWAVATNHPGWYHFINIAWNAAASVCVLLILALMFPLAAALAGALVFAVHPVHVEAVANVVGRAELMATTFSFIAALLWLRPGPYRKRLVAIPLLFAAALFSKESAVMMAPLLVLLDIATGRLQRAELRSWFRARAPLMLGLVLALALFLAARAAVLDTMIPGTLDPAIEVTPDGLPRIMTALQAWPHYARLFFFPRVLLADYGPRIILPATGFTPDVVAGALIFGGLIAGGLTSMLRGRRRTALALLWVPVAMLPVSNLLFPIGILVAERTLYLPLFALSIAAAAMMMVLAERLRARPQALAAAWATFTILVLVLSMRTIARIPAWHDTTSVFTVLMKDRPDSFRAHWHFARAAALAKNPDAALQSYERAIELWPYRPRLLKEASRYALHFDRPGYAQEVALRGHNAWPQDPEFPRTLARAALDTRDTATARIYIARGLQLAPDDTVLLQMLPHARQPAPVTPRTPTTRLEP